MEDWNFALPTRSTQETEDFFDNLHEQHERESTDLFNSVMTRLSLAINRRATFTVCYEEDIPEQMVTKKRPRKKSKVTVPRSPKLHTRKRLGLTRREKDGISLNKQRKDTSVRDKRQLSFIC